MKQQLLKEEWYHGPISRVEAETLLFNVSNVFFYILKLNECFWSLWVEKIDPPKKSRINPKYFIRTTLQFMF